MTGAHLFGAGYAAAILRAELGWLLTYGVHAAVAALVAGVLVRFAHPSPAAEHRLWKMALVLPLATACAAVGMEQPWFIRTPGSHAITAAVIAPATGGRAVVVAALAAAVGVLVGGARFAIGFLRWRLRLEDRGPCGDPRLREALGRIGGRFLLGHVDLSESNQVASPTVVGAHVICFPAGSTASLTEDELDAVMAHELAHLERGDQAWFFVAGLLKSALWMQPFNHRVVARLRRSAEIACDERAVAATGNALGLARGLSRFAHGAWVSGAGTDAHPAFGGGAREAHAVVDRVRRLAAAAPAAHPSRAAASRSWATASVLALVAIVSVNLNVTFRGASGAEAPDVAAVNRRAAALTAEEARLQAELNVAEVVPASTAAPFHLLEVEQDLRHVREERAWLERSVSQTVEP